MTGPSWYSVDSVLLTHPQPLGPPGKAVHEVVFSTGSVHSPVLLTLYFKQLQLIQPRPLSISAEPLSTSQLHPACQHLYCIWGLTNLACKHMPLRTVSCPQVILARVGRGRFVVIQVHVGVRSEIRVSTAQTAPVLDPAHLWVARQLSLLPRPSLPVGYTPEGTPSFS